MNMKLMLSYFAIVILVALASAELLASNYETELKRYDFEIEYLALKAVNREVNAREFAKDLNLKGTLFPPRLNPDQEGEN